ncbi:hypothetical protein TNCV_1651601 [Trichonephila clavipes]|nr:hypothetical protein TNCV_1651601 [Trichonephila clavipes]
MDAKFRFWTLDNEQQRPYAPPFYFVQPVKLQLILAFRKQEDWFRPIDLLLKWVDEGQNHIYYGELVAKFGRMPFLYQRKRETKWFLLTKASLIWDLVIRGYQEWISSCGIHSAEEKYTFFKNIHESSTNHTFKGLTEAARQSNGTVTQRDLLPLLPGLRIESQWLPSS